MICEHCGHTMPDGSLTCEECGTYLGKYAGARLDTGVRAMRQGRVSASTPTLPNEPRRIREYGDYELDPVPMEGRPQPMRARPQPTYGKSGSSRPDTRRGVPVNTYSRIPNVKHKSTRVHSVRRGGVNWMLLCVIVLVIAIAAGVGYLVYNSKSETGQRATARRNALSATESLFELAVNTRDPLVQAEREALLREWNSVPAQAYWLSGENYLDVGDVQLAITAFRIGDIVDPQNYDGLLSLANAYELNAEDEKAETVYLQLINTVSSFRTEAYTALIRMYQAQDRKPEAADMMLTAYNNTDQEAFRLEREDYIPLPPKISLNAGRYEISKMQENVSLTSPQGYDIYYTTDDSVILPEGGILSTGGAFTPQEGTVTLRAVCVSEDLVSDPVKVTYTFYYPSPPAPKCNLAPNTYKKLKEVSLRPGEIYDEAVTKAEKAEMEKHYTYYYTIDGSTPTEESPVYDGTPIKLPSGRVTLKAVCVNQYGKMSSILEVGYKFDVKPYPLDMYMETDVFTGFVMNKTTTDEFKQTFGNPKKELPTAYLGTGKEAVHLEYDWGYAVFMLDGSAWELVRIVMNRSLGNAPRGVGFGSTEDDVTAAYKDFGQLQSPNGERGLYYAYPNAGKVEIKDDGSRVIEYSCSTAASDVWVLQYWLGKNGRVNQIVHYYQP
ncbi:MAG: chitobiase/beta-hexosaminidase C-terminal domain-containing protein [Clostridia bacterium]|nr:chitobiase/beta-hexosaminidase C-terminal domain-containing protein [Clostridia bacterium]